MANIKSAKKRIQVSERNRLKNKSKKTEIRTYIKKFDEAIEANEVTEAKDLLKVIDKKLKKAALSSAVSKNSASRKISQLQKKLNAVAG